MAMDATAMATLIVTNIKSLNGDIDPAQEAQLILYWTEISQGIIDHVIAAAVVEVAGTVTGGGSSANQPTASTGGITA